MNKKQQKIMRGVGIAMAVGSVVAASASAMSSPSNKTKKAVKKAANTAMQIVDSVSSMM